MSKKSAICLVVDRLHAGMIGSYGNAWIRTPHIDRLASESFVLDQAYIDSPEVESLYRSYWLGSHPLTAGASSDQNSIISRLREKGIRPSLITDERAIAELPPAANFAERMLIQPIASESLADSIEQTQMAQLFSAAADWLTTARQPFLLWLHARAMAGPWDAPLELRQQYVEEDDPAPPEFTTPPREMLPEEDDPDHLLGINQAYAGQVSLLDACVGALVEALRSSPSVADTLLIFLSARGFPLGEHRRVGPVDNALYNELTQVPFMVRLPDGHGALARSQALVQPGAIASTLTDWWGLPVGPGPVSSQSLLPLLSGGGETVRDRAYIVGSSHERGLRTPGWYARFSGPEPDAKMELFSKPSDRWDVNEVSARCGEVVAAMKQAQADIEQAGQSGALPPVLLVEPD